ncbi:hypothetical protein EV401DRAFT_1895792 [Pisolithus croceorrhizus]|nr:hypothetical protein EV401DRAFT_1895792 [Pisolithus croceorrhizus]
MSFTSGVQWSDSKTSWEPDGLCPTAGTKTGAKAYVPIYSTPPAGMGRGPNHAGEDGKPIDRQGVGFGRLEAVEASHTTKQGISDVPSKVIHVLRGDFKDNTFTTCGVAYGQPKFYASLDLEVGEHAPLYYHGTAAEKGSGKRSPSPDVSGFVKRHNAGEDVGPTFTQRWEKESNGGTKGISSTASAGYKIPPNVEPKREIFMSELGTKRSCRKHGDKYGNGSLFASAQRGKINNTWQPPKHDVFNEASEVRCDPRGKLDRGNTCRVSPGSSSGRERYSMICVEDLAFASGNSKLHATRTGSFAAQDENPGGVAANRLRC